VRRLSPLSWRAAVVSLALVVASAVPILPTALVPVAAAGGTPSCTAAQLKPELGDVMVNQGLNYPILNRGKQTLIRLFLRLPSTCSTASTIAVSNATLTIQLTDPANANAVIPNSTGATSVTVAPAQTVSGNLAASIATNATSSPLFAIPASLVTPQSTFTGKFDLRITSATTVTYSVSGAAATTAAPATVAATAFPIVKNFEPKTSALRILVVPMGDASSPNTQFGAAARATMQTAMSDVARMAPVPDQTGTLAGNAGGVRFDFNPSLLDIGPNGLKLVATGSQFCGSATNFSTISAGLAAILNSYNAANTGAQADRVVGAIDSTISNGAANGCDEGRAAVPSGSAASVSIWVRATPDGTNPSPTGSILAMELLHTFGGCAYDSAATTRCPLATYHSTTATDFSAGRGYNVMNRTFLATPPTVMKLGSSYAAWNRTTTLYETNDYLLFSCVITPGFVLPTGVASIPGCKAGTATTGVTPGTAGTGSGVPAGPTYLLSGITDGTGGTVPVSSCPATRTTDPASTGESRYTATGTTIFGSFNTNFNSAPFPITAPDPASNYRLRYFNGGSQLGASTDYPGATGIGVPIGTSGADGDHGTTGGVAATPTINVAFPFVSSADQVVLVRNAGADKTNLANDVVLFCANRVAAPALSPTVVQHGSLIALTRTVGGVQNIWVSEIDGSNLRQLTSNALAGRVVQNPAWSPDGTRLAYLTSDPSDNVKVVNADGTGDHAVPGVFTVTRVGWSPDGADLVVYNGYANLGFFVYVNPDLGGPGTAISAYHTHVFDASESPDGQFVVGEEFGVSGLVAFPTAQVSPATNASVPTPVGGTATAPVWAPDGRHVAYTATVAGTTGVYVAPAGWPQTTGGAPSIGDGVKVSVADGRDPAFSADGQTLYYVADGTPGIWAVNVDGTNARSVLTGTADVGLSVSVATPMQRLALVCGPAICTENANGSGRELVTSGLGSYSGATWSHDGTLIAFTVPGGPNSNAGLYLVRPDGSGLRRITADLPTGGQAHPVWSPDDTRIALDDSDGIVVVKADGSSGLHPTYLTSGSHPSWSPDGTTLVYADSSIIVGGTNGIRFISAAGGTPSEAYCAGGPAAPLGGCAGPSGLSQPDWSPDGTTIAAIRGGLGAFLVTAPVSGLPHGPFLPGDFSGVAIGGGSPSSFQGPSWLPDSQRILLVAPRVDSTGANLAVDSSLWLADTAGGGSAQWFPSIGPASDGSPSWGPAAAPSNAAQVTSPVPSDVTISLSYTCPNGQTYPVATDVPASQVDAVSATFFAGFDPSTSCGGAPGTLGAVASDGFSLSSPLRTPTTLGTFTPVVKPPSPNIDGPVAGTTYGPGADIVLSGRATSPQGDQPTLAWTLRKGAGADVGVGTGQSIDLGGATIPPDFRQASGTWQPGSYVATMTATDSGGRTSTATIRFAVAAPPTVTVTGVVDGAVYAVGAVPTPACLTTDAGGGIGSEATLAVSGEPFGSPGSHTASCSGATDGGGAPAPDASVTYTVQALPSVSVTGVAAGATYVLGSVPTAGCSVTTGPGTAPVGTAPTVSVTGGTVNGVGAFTATCAGGTAAPPNGAPVALPPVSVSFTVKYGPNSGVLQPINPDNSSIFSRNRTVPVKFTLSGSPAATGFSTTAWTIKAVQVNCTTFDAAGAVVEDVPSSTPTSTFRWDGSQYLYNATVSALPAGTCLAFRIGLDDGVTIITSPVFKTK